MSEVVPITPRPLRRSDFARHLDDHPDHTEVARWPVLLAAAPFTIRHRCSCGSEFDEPGER